MGVSDDLAPSFTQKPQLRQEDDGNKLIFECQLLASPKPEISWYRSDELLKEDNRTKFKIQSIANNKFLVILELDDVIETDAGLYKVKAKNKMGEVAASINLNFSPADEEKQKQIDGKAPTFARKPAIRQEDDGKRLIFECRIEAEPVPSVVWFHNTMEVKPGSRHKLVAFTLKSKPTIWFTFSSKSDESCIRYDINVVLIEQLTVKQRRKVLLRFVGDQQRDGGRRW
ncbi:unnamed protein product [Parnassius apollo]|uniref:(apollo) hypothetical protein n=1 Tax=Parnassius apollo TaxID=110799 RepID=A0A8S3XR22_PARAO|nr:unnamed protein product [Parnassius apollo]